MSFVNKQTITPTTKKVCFFCQASKETPTVPSYTDVVTLRKFVTDRGKIVGKMRSGICAKHQRQLAKHIKYARHLALLPFTVRVQKFGN